MKSFLQKILFIAPLALLPFSFVYAGPNVVWSDELSIDGETITGYLTVGGIDSSTPPMNLFIFADGDNDFDPYTSYALLGLAQNGPISFQAPSNGATNFFLPVLVDEASFNGGFSPYGDQSQFQLFSVGQVAQISSAGGGGSTGGGGSGGGNNTGGGGAGGGWSSSGAGGGGGVTNDSGTENTANTLGWPEAVLDNPLQVSDLNSFIVGLLNALLKIGIPVMTVFLVYSGLRLVMARGNEKELGDAKKNLLWVIIGIAILLGAWTIVKILKGTFDEIDLAYINSLINHFV